MKRILAIILTVVLTLTALLMDATPVCAASNWLAPMEAYSKSGHYCGPSSGASIGQYYKSKYPNLPPLSPDSYKDMYHRLYDYMDTAILGTTYPYNYGPGFVEMALHYGYDDFSYTHYGPGTDAGPVTSEFYAVIKDAINNGWPVALFSTGLLVGFKGVQALPGSDDGGLWPCEVWHVIAIKGYADGYSGVAQVINCTDNYSGADHLYLDWNEIWRDVGQFLEAVIIKDVDTFDGPTVEAFEWGNIGESLSTWNTWGGEVDWEVTTQGASVAQISDTYHYGGSRSARFYRQTSNVVYAYYSLLEPSYIGFWVLKDGTAYTDIRIGNSLKYIWFQIDSAEVIRYYGSTGYKTVPYTFPVYVWRHIEFKNIKWDLGTYDIYIGGIKKASATMRSGVSYKENLYFGSWSGSGTFWIDDITDSLRPLT